MFYIDNEIQVETRFDPMKFMNFNGDNIDSLDSYLVTNIHKLASVGTFTVTNEEQRPDLVSYKIYNDTQYWWILMLYNKILDISEFKAGMELVYPDKANFETLYQNASLLRKTQ